MIFRRQPAAARAKTAPHCRRVSQAACVRILTILMAVGSLAGCATVPQSPYATTYTLHLQPNGSELDVTGRMIDGLADAVRKQLDANPGINMIHLNSQGGKTSEGYKLALLIKERHLATYTSSLCASSCTVAFIAGSPRYLAQAARLGFHSTSIDGQSSSSGNDAVRILYQEAGLPEAFIDKALHTSPGDIWMPNEAELVESHVVDAFVDRNNFPPPLMHYWENAADLDAKLKADKFLNLLSSVDNKSYQKIVHIYLDGEKTGRGFAQMKAEVSDFISKTLVPSYVRRALDEKILQIQRLHLKSIEYLEANAPGACPAAAVPQRSIVSDAGERNLPPDLIAAGDAAFIDLVKSALADPTADRSAAGDEQISANFHRDLATRAPELTDTLNALKQQGRDPKLFCKLLVEYYQAILKQPPATAAAISRAMITKSS